MMFCNYLGVVFALGQFVEIDNEKYYQIQNYQEMPDFFISMAVSRGDGNE